MTSYFYAPHPPSSDGDVNDEDLHKLLTPDQMFIRSTDTLHQSVVDQTIPIGWGDRPPLLSMPDGEETPDLLKGVIRQGVPPALRCAVWLSNIVQTVHPHQPQSYWHEYRTLAKARDLDTAYNRLLQSMISGEDGASTKDPSCWASMDIPTFGRETAIQNDASIPPSGKLALQRVLLALNQVLGLEHAPMLPRLTALLLCVMSESYAFCALREMAHYANYYIPSHALEHAAWCGAFGMVMKKLHESTYEYLYNRGILEVDGLKPIFQDLFVGILQPQHVLRIIDIYTLEGCSVIYRFGIALLDLFKNESAAFQMIARTNEFWDALRDWTHDPRFNFEYLVSRAYGTHGRGPSSSFGLLGRVLVFPRRQVLVSIIKMEYARLLEETYESETRPPVQPLGLVQPVPSEDPGKEAATPILAQPIENRRHLAEWLPLSLRLTNLELLYSTNHHGRLLEMFYPAVRHAKHTILLCEVLNATNVQTVIGVYASQAWRPSTRVYGDGECFLFRLQPADTAQCWKWTPRIRVLKDEDFEERNTNNINNATAVLEQFMVSTRTFLSVGGSPDGSSGFRLNEDFTKGESSTAVGFDNDPLVVSDGDSIFDVGLVEVYGLVSPW